MAHTLPKEPTPPAPTIPPGALVLAPRAVAIGSVLLAIACIGALAIVATQKNVDALATIALAVAIFAFAAQLIIYIGQVGSTNQQLFLAQQVQRETATLLSGIQATADATQSALVQQYDRVINRLIATTADTEGAPPDAPNDSEDESREDLLSRLRKIVREEVAQSQSMLTPSPLLKLSPPYVGDVSIYRDASTGLLQSRPSYVGGYPIYREDPSNLKEDPSKLKED